MIWNNEFFNMYDIPPTLYSFMESIVNYGKEEQTKIKDLASASREKIFNFNYPITPELKENFEVMFLNHYMFRRINYDTFTSFQIHLQVKLQTIMPKYLKMLEGFNKLDFDGNREIHNKETGSTGSVNTHDVTDNRYSDTPQNALQDVQDGTYMTDYTYNQGNSESTSESSSNESIIIDKFDTIDEYIKFMKVANNVYELIFKECDSLFYGLV